MLQWLGISAVNPLLLWGALAIAAPIIIHLLSKRKFRTVEWAAMDFLLDADKRNRRRVRMENLILLVLRCLAVLLIALLVSRPFLSPAGMASLGVSSSGVERIVLLDDSPSTQTSAGRQTAFDEAKESLKRMVRDMANQRSGDTFTLMLTSDPQRPRVSGRHPTDEGLVEIEQVVDELTPADVPANLDAALLALEDTLSAPGGNVNRVVYLLSDLRRRDWAASEGAQKERSLSATIERIANSADSVSIVDIGNDAIENLAISEIATQDKTLVAGVEATFEVTVVNAGTRDVDDVEVVLAAENVPELRRTIENIPAGQSGLALFTLKFADPGDVQVQASLSGADVLSVDNTRHFAARVTDGVQVLVVDGDPSSEPAASETHFLQRALAPEAIVSSTFDESAAESDPLSGNVVEVVAENQFETLPLTKYQIIYLCNLYRISDERYASLENWVASGGGLVFFLGDQVDAENYNARLYAEGKGLLPVSIVDVGGDDSQSQWAGMNVSAVNHPVLKIFEGTQNPFLSDIHFFRWWKTTPDQSDVAAGRLSLIATLNDEDASPLMIEEPVGDGRVLLITSSADRDWTDWPVDPTYLITLQEINRYMSRRASGASTNLVGAPIRVEVDAARYNIDVRIRPPDPEAEPVAAQAVSDSAVGASSSGLKQQNASAADARPLVVNFEDTSRRGTYRVELERRDGGVHNLLYAANLDPTEGDLRRIEDSELRKVLGDANVQIERNKGALSLDLAGSRVELWKSVLLLLGGILCVEQVLAWLFGRRRG